MPKYKVWLHVEKVDEAKDKYEDQGMPELMGEFTRRTEAERLVHFLKLQAEGVFPFLEEGRRRGDPTEAEFS